MADQATCPRCEGERERRTYKDGAKRGKSYWYCRQCVVARVASWRQVNPDRLHEQRQRSKTREATLRANDPLHGTQAHLKKRYRLSLDERDALLEQQGGGCAICKSTATQWYVDHDHSCCPGSTTCGRCVRGLLCAACNIALGLVRDDPQRLSAMASYLERHAMMSKRAHHG